MKHALAHFSIKGFIAPLGAKVNTLVRRPIRWQRTEPSSS